MSNKIFDHFKKLFNDNGFRLYMIGGTSRDFLLKREILDYDFVTDATPDEMKMFVENGNYVYSYESTDEIINEPSYNQIDIPISQGENVDIQNK